ncbi:MAG: type II toxin-antitoxin system RelE/ParE family toxin [Clostridia bacterium]|nr:type II toxin-antitoxin system RelE/ParE family toxin [Clostridia bacterium]MDD4145585.1 type II toxin-antitoxin system RelE/ParE family toxin [Clostridia bacterium]MDD4665238.1 type II toxin-antitoxin system RelE/ParE family toxin [Clostridia bacterium]
MKYVIKYAKSCLKYLQKLDRITQLRIINAVNRLPYGDVKPLQSKADDYRLRVGNYRIIFNKDDQHLLIRIIKIAPRGEVYKKL